jgi:hypothetical protein
MLVFFLGAFCCFSLELWWAALGCIIGFIIAAFVIRGVSTVESQTSSEDSIVFL